MTNEVQKQKSYFTFLWGKKKKTKVKIIVKKSLLMTRQQALSFDPYLPVDLHKIVEIINLIYSKQINDKCFLEGLSELVPNGAEL